MDDSEVDHQVFTTARRYNWYRQQYVPLFEQIINEANDMQAALFAGAYEDQTTGSYTEDLYQLVDKYVWAFPIVTGKHIVVCTSCSVWLL